MKKISTATVKSFLAESKKDDIVTRKFPVGDSEFEVSIKTNLTTAEKSTFINRVLSGCFDRMQNLRPEYVTPMLRATILQMCTNLPVISLKNETGDDGESLMDIEAMNELYAALNLDCLDDSRYQVMLNEIVQLTHTAIDWQRQRIIANIKSEGSRAIKRLVDSLINATENFDLDKLTEYASLISKNTENMDEQKLVEAVLDAENKSEDNDTEVYVGDPV